MVREAEVDSVLVSSLAHQPNLNDNSRLSEKRPSTGRIAEKAGEMAQPVNCILCQHENLSSDPRTHVPTKKLSTVAHICSSSAEVAEPEDSL